MTGARLALGALIVVAVGVLTAARVSAHARYESSTPAKGEVLSASPPQVSIKFSQDVQKITGTYGIDVVPAPAMTRSGPDVTSGPAVLSDDDRSVMTVPLQPNLPPGRYLATWKNVSDADGDAAEGAFAFYVGVEPTEADLAADRALEEAEQEDETPAASPTTGPSTAAPTTPAAAATATPVAGGGDDDDDDGNAGMIIAIVVIVVLVAVVAGGAAVRLRRQ